MICYVFVIIIIIYNTLVFVTTYITCSDVYIHVYFVWFCDCSFGVLGCFSVFLVVVFKKRIQAVSKLIIYLFMSYSETSFKMVNTDNSDMLFV